VLNGTSSAGKTTLARAFVEARAAAGECWILVGIDDFTGKLPWQWFDIGSVRGPYGSVGLRFHPTEDGLVASAGPVAARAYAAYRRCVAVWARQGFDVLVDEVVFDGATALDWSDALAGLDVTWVGVHCDPDVAEARERARADREPGLARGMARVAHEHVRYDAELDTTDTPVDGLVAALARIVEEHRGNN
jgi:chloramphenicol 3-O phosphotransferase